MSLEETNIGDHSMMISRTKDSLSESSRKRQRPDLEVLEEDTYLEAMSHIIERDFYPDLSKMKLQNGYLAAIEEGDVGKARNLGIAIARMKTGNVISGDAGLKGKSPSIPETSSNIVQDQTPLILAQPLAQSQSTTSSDLTSQPKLPIKSMSLDGFTSKYTSEDNASFSKIIESTNKTKKERYKWAYDKEKNQLVLESGPQPLLIESGNIIANSNKGLTEVSKTVESWKFKARNALMYGPEGSNEVDPAFQSSIRGSDNTKSIQHSNTRLQAPHSSTALLKTSSERIKTDQVWKEMAKATPALFPDANQTPVGEHVNGYGFVPSTPTINPSDLEDEQLIMTWGEVAGTPLLLDTMGIEPNDGKGPKFRMDPTPKRDQLGYKLAEKSKKKIDGVRTSISHRIVSPRTPASIFPKPLPKALAAKVSGSSGGFDVQLRASYSPLIKNGVVGSRSSATPTPKTTIRNNVITPSLIIKDSPLIDSNASGAKTSGSEPPSATTASIMASGSITDDLLNF